MIMKQFKEFIEERKLSLYRGHDKGSDPMEYNKQGILWITPDRKLASTYGAEISEIDINIPKSGRIMLGEINRYGTIIDLLSNVRPPRTKKQKKLYDELIYNWGSGTQEMDLPKFLHKIGSELTIKYFKSMNGKVLEATEDGVRTYGILK